MVNDTFVSKLSPTTVAERGIWKGGREESFRRCSSGSINTPVTPKPSQIYATTTDSDIKFIASTGDLTYGNTYSSGSNTTNTVRELQHSLKESKEYTNALETKLREQAIAQQTLKQELIQLKEKYISELVRADNISHEKSKIELELEDLTATLFEQANEMVAHEKKISRVLEEDNGRLCKELSAALGRLAEESMQLIELKDKFSMQDTDAKQLQVSHPTSPTMSRTAEVEQKNKDNDISRPR